MLPLALKLEEGGESRAPLAVVIMGGVISSTLLTLVLVPSVYTILDDASWHPRTLSPDAWWSARPGDVPDPDDADPAGTAAGPGWRRGLTGDKAIEPPGGAPQERGAFIVVPGDGRRSVASTWPMLSRTRPPWSRLDCPRSGGDQYGQRQPLRVLGPKSWPLEQAIRWAAEHAFSRVDFNADNEANFPASFTPERVASTRSLAAEHGVAIGIHTSSAVNMAEITPVMAAAADAYVRQNLDLAQSLGCSHVILHGGFHFSSDVEERFGPASRAWGWRFGSPRSAAWRSISRTTTPSPSTLRSTTSRTPSPRARRYFDVVSSPKLRWACNVGHALLVPDGFEGFLDAFGADTIGQSGCTTPTACTRSTFVPARASWTSAQVFTTLHARGYRGPFTLDFGGPTRKRSGATAGPRCWTRSRPADPAVGAITSGRPAHHRRPGRPAPPPSIAAPTRSSSSNNVILSSRRISQASRNSV